MPLMPTIMPIVMIIIMHIMPIITILLPRSYYYDSYHYAYSYDPIMIIIIGITI